MEYDFDQTNNTSMNRVKYQQWALLIKFSINFIRKNRATVFILSTLPKYIITNRLIYQQTLHEWYYFILFTLLIPLPIYEAISQNMRYL